MKLSGNSQINSLEIYRRNAFGNAQIEFFEESPETVLGGILRRKFLKKSLVGVSEETPTRNS